MNSEATGRGVGEEEFAEDSEVEAEKWWMRIGEPLLTGVKCGVDLTGTR